MIEIFIKGFLVFAAIIAAIGGQNAFVLKQALLKQHIFAVCLLCTFCDLLLIFLGVFGLGALINQSDLLLKILIILGIIFLSGYALKCFFDAYQNNYKFNLDGQKINNSRNKTLLAAFGVTLLNPHVYLDTVIIVGGIGATYQMDEKWFYAFGASFASLVWFAFLGIGARALIPIFKKKITWRILDIMIGLIMLYIAYDLTSMF